MFDTINAAFSRAKNDLAENAFILESVLDVEEVLPGSEEELDDEVDVDSVPDNVYTKIDKVLDKYVSSGKYDDTEAEEMVDEDDYDEEDVSDEEINAIITECVSIWESAEVEDEDDEDDDKDDDEKHSSSKDDDNDDVDTSDFEPDDDFDNVDEPDEDDSEDDDDEEDEGDVKVSEEEMKKELNVNESAFLFDDFDLWDM